MVIKKGVKVSKSKVSNVGGIEKTILQNLYESRAGLIVSFISKINNIPKRKVYRILNKLREKGLIENIYPIWKIVNGEVNFVSQLLKDNNIFELHDFSVVLKLIKKPDWWNKRKSRLMKLKDWQFSNVDFGKGDKNPFQQLKNNEFVIQTYPESIIIISRKRYYSSDPYKIIQEAMKDLLNLIEFLNERFRFNFFPDGIPSLEIRSNHFNRLNDYIAKRYKKEGRRFLIETEVGKCWIDYSEPFGKEADTPDIQYTLEKRTKDIIINKPMLPSEIQGLVGQAFEQIIQVTQNQRVFDANMSSHLEVLENIGKAITDLKEEVKKLNGK